MLCRPSLIVQLVKNLPAMQEIGVQFLGWEDPLEKEMTTHSSILAWRIPQIEEPGRLQSLGSQESDMTATKSPPKIVPVSHQQQLLSCFIRIQLFSNLWTIAHQSPLSIEFSRQEYWSGLPCPSPGDLPDARFKPSILHYRQILYRLSYLGRRMLEPTKKRQPTSKDRDEASARWLEGHNRGKIKSHTCQGDPQTGE